MTFDNQNKKTGLKRIFSAIENSCYGFYWMKENETAFKQEVILVLLLSVISLFLNINTVERILLIASLLLILLAATLNSAIEVIVDRIGLDLNELSGVAKDLGSAAVFISFAIAALVWGGILCSNT